MIKPLEITLLLVAAICAGAPATGQPPADDPLAAAAARDLLRAQAIVAASHALAVEERGTAPDGTPTRRLVRRPRPDPINHGQWVPTSLDAIATPGTPLALGPKGEWPRDIAIDDAGTVLIAGAEGVVAHGVDTAGAITIAQAIDADLQWDATGSRLLVAAPQGSAILAWPGGAVLHDLDARGINGALLWAPRGESLWKFSDIFDPDASQAVRILIRVREVPLDPGGEARDLLTEPRRLATIGTFPATGRAWGHPTTLYQILPDPAPIWPLDDQFQFSEAPMTNAGDGVDLDPEADAGGRLWFVRASRVVDTGAGVALSPSARAWMRASDGTETMATGEPTYDVAVSPDGQRVAVLVRRAGSGLVVATSAEALLARDLSAQREARVAFDTAAGQVLDDLRGVFALLSIAEPFRAKPVDYETPLKITPADLAILDSALRDSLRRRVGLELAPDSAALGQLDGFLRAADGLWPEEPATILALAATYGNVLAREPDVRWELDGILPSLSNDMQNASASDDLLYTMHTPFLAAREALAGRLSFDATATELATRWERPISLVENFDAQSVAAVFARPMRDRQLDPEGDLEQLAASILAADEPNDAALTLLWSRGLKEGNVGVALAASMALAENNPTSPEALLRAAEILQALEFNAAASVLLQRAGELAPDDLDVWLDLGEAYFRQNDLDGAERSYRRAQELDRTNGNRLQITDALESIALRRPTP